MKSLLYPLALLLLVSPVVMADERVGLTATEAFALVEDQSQAVLFIDVRDPVEIMFTGFTDHVDENIPFQLVDRTRWNEDKGSFPMDRNPNFVAEVDAALKEKGLDRSARIITMCRSGSTRGMPSAAFLRERGFPNATYIIHGFQGDRVDEGPQKGRRVKNGWVNEGLPWSPEANPEKIYRPEAEGAVKWLVIVTSDSPATQTMALILARAERERNTPLRILLCDQAGYLAASDSSLEKAGGPNRDPKPRRLLRSLMELGAEVQVCGIFFATSGLAEDDLLPGVTTATPDVISAEMSDTDTKVFAF